MIKSFTVKLEPRSKKNCMRILHNRRTGKPFVAPSVTYEQYQMDARWFIPELKIDYPVNIKCLFYMKTRKRVDLTNLLESIDDIMVKYGTIIDDDHKILVSHDGSRVLYDKENPRTEVYITVVGENTEKNLERQIVNLTKVLKKLGYSDSDIRDILVSPPEEDEEECDWM